MENGPFHHKLELLSISTERIFCVHTQNISFPKTELISASHLDITGHLKIQCYLWFLFSLLLSWFVASGDLVVLSLENRYGKSIIHMNLQSIMVIKLSHTPMLTHSHCELCRICSVKTAGVIYIFFTG